MKKILLILILTLFLGGCNNKTNNYDSLNGNLKKLMKENEYIILDVRTDEEFKESHLVDAINISYDLIDENVDLDKEKIIFVYCKSGNRSKIAYHKLIKLGYRVYDLGAYSDIDLPKE